MVALGLLRDVVLQGVLGLIIVALVYLVTLAVLRTDRLLTSGQGIVPLQQRLKTKVVDGYIDAFNLANTRLNTVNPLSQNFANIQRSYNRKGGAQFTYAFWIYLGDTTPANLRNKDILLRGDNRSYNYRTTHGGDSREGSGVVVKAPRIRFGNTFRDFVVEFNTLDDVMTAVNMTAQRHPSDTSLRHNAMGMMDGRWTLLTFTFEDNVPINDFENGLVVRMFVNDILYYTHRQRTTLRQNHGDLFLFPGEQPIRGCRIGDLTYYNYAVGLKKVKDTFAAGRPQHHADMGTDTGLQARPLHLSEYGKVDLYNR